MKNSFKIATIIGIPIEVNASWLIILGLIVYSLAKGYFPYVLPGLTPIYYWAVGLTSALLLFICLLLHELSHSLVAKRNKLPISKITLFIFGGVAQMEKEPTSPIVEFKMAAAGPLMSIFLAATFFTITKFSQPIPIIWAISNYLFTINSVIVIFNLVPGFPLDGGRILRAALWFFLKDIRKATKIASIFGKIFALLLIGLGIIFLFSGNTISGIWFTFIGLFLFNAAETSYRQLIMKKIFSKTKVSDVMSKNVIWVDGKENIENVFNNYVLKFRHSTFPVLEDDILLGIITFHDIKDIPREEWKNNKAKDVCIPINNKFITSSKSHITTALSKIAGNTIGRLLVIEKNKIVGIISQKDIIKLFEIKSHIEENQD